MQTRNHDMLPHFIKDRATSVSVTNSIAHPKMLAERAKILLDDLGKDLMDLGDNPQMTLYRALHLKKTLEAKCFAIRDIVSEVHDMLDEIDEYGNENFPAPDKPEEVVE